MSGSENRTALVPLPNVIGKFSLDLLIAAVMVSGISIAVGLIWGAARWIQVVPTLLAAGEGNDALSPEQITALIGQPGPLAMIMMTWLGMSAAAMVLYFWRRRADRSECATSMRAVYRPRTWFWGILTGIVLSVFGGAAGLVAGMFGIVPEPSNQKLIQQAMSQYPVFITVFAIALAPAYEELLFRRIFFGRFLKAGFPFPGMLLSSAAFAFVHEVPGLSANDWPAMLLLWFVYGTMGMVFALAYRKSGTLWTAIIAHAVNNAIALMILVRQGLP
ncbi:MAG: CPBP family intramembrane metalloprotease [Xanthomonadaceae bacterium]|jgi:membrane protease YdiL (CAAX protease family)|nr:CPBP family intramembrane metalloprotease [Xanthomonadaceae bacterium]